MKKLIKDLPKNPLVDKETFGKVTDGQLREYQYLYRAELFPESEMLDAWDDIRDSCWWEY